MRMKSGLVSENERRGVPVGDARGTRGLFMLLDRLLLRRIKSRLVPSVPDPADTMACSKHVLVKQKAIWQPLTI